MTDATALNAILAKLQNIDNNVASLTNRIIDLEKKLDFSQKSNLKLQNQVKTLLVDNKRKQKTIERLSTQSANFRRGKDNSILYKIKSKRSGKYIDLVSRRPTTAPIYEKYKNRARKILEEISADYPRDPKAPVSAPIPAPGPIEPQEPEKTKNSKTFRVNYNDPSQVDQALLAGLDDAVKTAKGIPSADKRIAFHLQVGDQVNESYQANATTANMLFDFSETPQLERKNEIEGIVNYVGNDENYFTLPGEDPQSTQFIVQDNKKYGLLLDREQTSFGNKFVLNQVEEKLAETKGYHQTFRKFMTSVFQSAQDSDDKPFKRFMARFVEPNARWSLGVLMKIFNLFGVYYQEVINKDYDSNDYTRKYNRFKLEEGGDSEDPEQVLGSLGNQARVIVKTNLEYVGAGQFGTNQIKFISTNKFDLTLFNVKQDKDRCFSAAVNSRHPGLIPSESSTIPNVLCYLPYIYIMTKDQVSLFISEKNRYVFQPIPAEDLRPCENLIPVYNIGQFTVYYVAHDISQPIPVCVYVVDNQIKKVVGCVKYLSDGIDYLEEQPQNSLKILKVGSSDFVEALENINSTNPSSKYAWNNRKQNPVVFTVTEQSEHLNLWYEDNHISIIADVCKHTTRICPRCQMSVRQNDVMRSKTAGVKVCLRCDNEIRNEKVVTQPTILGAFDLECKSTPKGFEAYSVCLVVCRHPDYQIPVTQKLPLNSKGYAKLADKHKKALEKHERVREELVHSGASDQEIIEHERNAPVFKCELTSAQLDAADTLYQSKCDEIIAEARRRGNKPFARAFEAAMAAVTNTEQALDVLKHQFNFEIIEFNGTQCLTQFAEYLIDLDKKGEHLFLFSHNGARYDNLIVLETFLNQHYIKHFSKNRFINQGSQVIKFIFGGHTFYDFCRYVSASLSKVCKSFGIPQYLRKIKTLKNFIDPFTGEKREIKVKEFFNLEPEDGFKPKVDDMDEWLTRCGVLEEFTRYGVLDSVSLLIGVLLANDSLSKIMINQIMNLELKAESFPEIFKLEKEELAELFNQVRYGAIIKPTIGSWTMNMVSQKEKTTKELIKRLQAKLPKDNQQAFDDCVAVLTSPKLKFNGIEPGEQMGPSSDAKKPILDLNALINQYHVSSNGFSGIVKIPPRLQELVLNARIGGMSLVRPGYEGLVEFENGAVLLDVVSLYPWAAVCFSFLNRQDVQAEFPEAINFGKISNRIINKYFGIKSDKPVKLFPIIQDDKADVARITTESYEKLPQQYKLLPGIYTLDFIIDPINESKRWLSVTPGHKAHLDWFVHARVSKHYYENNREKVDKYKDHNITIEETISVDHMTLAMLKYFGCQVRMSSKPGDFQYQFFRASDKNYLSAVMGECLINKMREDLKPEAQRNKVERQMNKDVVNISTGKANETSTKTKVKFVNNATYEEKFNSENDYVIINGVHCVRESIYNEGIPNIIGELIYSVSKALMFHYFEAVNWEFYRVETDSMLTSARWLKVLKEKGYVGNMIGQLEPEKIKGDIIIKRAYLLGPKAALFITESGKQKAVFKGFPKSDVKKLNIIDVFNEIIKTGTYRHPAIMNFKRNLFTSTSGVQKHFAAKQFTYPKVLKADGKSRIIFIDDSSGKDRSYEF